MLGAAVAMELSGAELRSQGLSCVVKVNGEILMWLGQNSSVPVEKYVIQKYFIPFFKGENSRVRSEQNPIDR